MNDNIKITKQIMTRNIKGSFITIFYREAGKEVDFLDQSRITVYHHIILKQDNYVFVDIMDYFEMNDNSSLEIYLNYYKDVDDNSFVINVKELEKSNQSIEYFFETLREIFTNESMCVLHINDNLFKDFCNYKIHGLKNHTVPIYLVKMLKNTIESVECYHGEDILKTLNAKKDFVKCLELNT